MGEIVIQVNGTARKYFCNWGEFKFLSDWTNKRISQFIPSIFKRDNGKTYKDTYDCKICDKETMHEIYCTGHERDSSGDRKTCLVCGEYSQL